MIFGGRGLELIINVTMFYVYEKNKYRECIVALFLTFISQGDESHIIKTNTFLLLLIVPLFRKKDKLLRTECFDLGVKVDIF